MYNPCVLGGQLSPVADLITIFYSEYLGNKLFRACIPLIKIILYIQFL